ncbi:MAG: hypothetical protein PWP65_2098 [Clostridia bacterium]|nr:hypothetical protein [Clostridia bacterium]
MAKVYIRKNMDEKVTGFWLETRYEEKDAVKATGGKWDPIQRQWKVSFEAIEALEGKIDLAFSREALAWYEYYRARKTGIENYVACPLCLSPALVTGDMAKCLFDEYEFPAAEGEPAPAI